jgi:thiol-disulfide isomerase/thioredoxin
MRTLLAALAAVGLLTAGAAADDDKDKTSKEPAVTLKAGDPSPALKATRWLQGDEVKTFERGKVYVVEVWATWCGPCIAMMPHLAQLQKQYKDKGVTFIGFSTKTQDEEAKIAAFVKKRGPKLGYTFAYGDDSDAWMQASGQGSIPCSFVVDRSSRVAYIGHPVFLDIVLPKVIAGTWDPEAGSKKIKRIDRESEAVFALLAKDTEAGLKALADFEARNPALKDIPYFTGPRLAALLQTGKVNEAKYLAESVMKKAAEHGDTAALRTVSATLRTEAEDNKDLMGLALKAAKGMLTAAGEHDPLALINLASTYYAAGDKAKAKEYGKKAVEAASKESAGLKRYVEKEAEKFDAE